ncbi:MAG: sulfotransferase family 2 domain-containing protein [Paracoccaceae bacterium]
MLISVEHKFIFVANTKAASTSIEAILAEHAQISGTPTPKGKHLPLSRIRQDFVSLTGTPDHGFDSFFRFGVMRDPLDWILSWFRYRKGNDVEAPLPDDMTFAEFWQAADWNIFDDKGNPYSQGRMFLDAQGKPLADVIIPYDQLDATLPQVLAALGISASVPRLNVSLIGREAATIPTTLRAAVRAHYTADYALYDRLDALNAAGMARLRQRSA